MSTHRQNHAIRLDDETYAALRGLAEREERPLATVVRRAILTYRRSLADASGLVEDPSRLTPEELATVPPAPATYLPQDQATAAYFAAHPELRGEIRDTPRS